jgi:hypothetical protein
MVGSAGIEPAAFTQEWREAILYGFLQVTTPELRHSPKGQANTCFLEPVVMPGLTTTPTFLVILTIGYLYIIESEPEKALRAALPFARRTDTQKPNIARNYPKPSELFLSSGSQNLGLNFSAAAGCDGEDVKMRRGKVSIQETMWNQGSRLRFLK